MNDPITITLDRKAAKHLLDFLNNELQFDYQSYDGLLDGVATQIEEVLNATDTRHFYFVVDGADMAYGDEEQQTVYIEGLKAARAMAKEISAANKNCVVHIHEDNSGEVVDHS